MIEDRSFGIIPLRKIGDEWEVFLIQHKNGLHWGFPKGHQNHLESEVEAAIRELKEETGLHVESLLSDEPFIDSYQFIKDGVHIFKTVSYFLYVVSGDVHLQTEEIISGNWYEFNQARSILTFDESKKILDCVKEFLK